MIVLSNMILSGLLVQFTQLCSVSNIYNINQTVNFTNTSVGGITYDWKVNSISQSTALNYSYTFSYQGYYSVSLTASNGFCQDTKTYYYTVIDTSTNTPPVDSCLRTTFQKSYSSINRNLEIHSMEPTADGGTVYGGTVKMPLAAIQRML
ncbi:MAG: PKD domain-containing protein [Chitinophagaceae bacterium]|nr:PKD domain-containing protein [Chitinophagaceae bacterium]